MSDVLNLVGKFGQLSPSYVAQSLGIPHDDAIANFALKESFDILIREFEKETRNPIAAREEVVNFLYKHLSGRYSLFQQFLPLHFPDQSKERRDAMTLALIGDLCISRMNPHIVPDQFDKNLILLSYEMFAQADELITYGETEERVIPESLYLAQIDGLDTLDLIETHLLSYSLDEIEKNVVKRLIALAKIVDIASPAGQALHGRLLTVSDKVDDRVAAMPTLSVVGIAEFKRS